MWICNKGGNFKIDLEFEIIESNDAIELADSISFASIINKGDRFLSHNPFGIMCKNCNCLMASVDMMLTQACTKLIQNHIYIDAIHVDPKGLNDDNIKPKTYYAAIRFRNDNSFLQSQCFNYFINKITRTHESFSSGYYLWNSLTKKGGSASTS